MGYKTIKTDVSKDYFNAREALIDEGFESVGGVLFYAVGKGLQNRSTYEKDGVKYYYVGMNNFNSTIYSIKLRKVNELSEFTLID
jgi:hypothetical protein